MQAFEDKLSVGQFLLLDGAMGTELSRRGFDYGNPPFAPRALLSNPDLVLQIHKDYVEAGCDLITANTLCTAAVALQSAGLEAAESEINELAFELATEAAAKSKVEGGTSVLAAIGPLSTFFPSNNPTDAQLMAAQEGHATQLALAGAEMALCETMPSVREARIAVQAAIHAGLEVVVSFVPKDSRHLISGETIDTAVRAIEPLGPKAMCLNCCSLEVMDSALATLMALSSVPVGAYASIGTEPADRDESTSTIHVLRHAEHWLEFGVRIIGGCCGTTPEHIRTLRKKLPFGPPKTED